MLGAAIRVQLKCRASATQRQPPINKRDYRRTTKRISVQEDCSAANQPVRGAGCQPPPQSPLSYIPFSLSRSFFATFPTVAFSFSVAAVPTALSALSPPPLLPRPLSAADSPLLLLSRSLVRSYVRAYERDAHTRCPQQTDILPSASGAHNKKVETSSLCGHVPHPPYTGDFASSLRRRSTITFLAAAALLLATLALEKSS